VANQEPAMMPAHSVRGARLSTWNPHPRCDLLARAGEVFDLRQIADSRNDILAEAAGITAGSWTPGRPPMSATS
jgi:hypothetical protein